MRKPKIVIVTSCDKNVKKVMDNYQKLNSNLYYKTSLSNEYFVVNFMVVCINHQIIDWF